MADVNTVVRVNISQNTQTVSRPGFGVPLILGTTGFTGSDDRIRFYTGMAGVAEDFLTSDPEYKAAEAYFSQDPSPTRLAIGARDANVAAVKTLTLAGDLVASNTVSLSVNGETVEETFDTDQEITMTALAAAIAAVDGVASAVLSTSPYRVITVTATAGYDLTLGDLSITGGASQTTGAFATSEAGKNVASELDLLLLSSGTANDWYVLVLTSRLEADQLRAAAWIESSKKIFVACSSDTAILASTTTDVLAKLEAKGYNRTFFLPHESPGDFPDAAWVGECLTFDPGQETWAFKTLVGIEASPLTATQAANVIDTKKGNTYETYGNVNITRPGQMVSGRFIDQVRFIDWLESELKLGLFELQITNPKIPYTDNGMALLENKIREKLQAGVAIGGLAEGFTVTVPQVADVSSTNRAERKARGLSFSGRVTGAIHDIELDGTVTP